MNPAEFTLILSPGFADPGEGEAWATRLAIRFEAEQAVRLGAREGEEFSLRPGETRRFHGARGELPWALPDGFVPLGLFLLESGGLIWTWETPLRSP